MLPCYNYSTRIPLQPCLFFFFFVFFIRMHAAGVCVLVGFLFQLWAFPRWLRCVAGARVVINVLLLYKLYCSRLVGRWLFGWLVRCALGSFLSTYDTRPRARGVFELNYMSPATQRRTWPPCSRTIFICSFILFPCNAAERTMLTSEPARFARWFYGFYNKFIAIFYVFF